MNEPYIAHSWPKNAGETVRVSLDQFKGNDIIDIRVWFGAEANELKPGRSGITISARHLPDLARGIMAALDEARRRGLVSDEGGRS